MYSQKVILHTTETIAFLNQPHHNIAQFENNISTVQNINFLFHIHEKWLNVGEAEKLLNFFLYSREMANRMGSRKVRD